MKNYSTREIQQPQIGEEIICKACKDALVYLFNNWKCIRCGYKIKVLDVDLFTDCKPHDECDWSQNVKDLYKKIMGHDIGEMWKFFTGLFSRG